MIDGKKFSLMIKQNIYSFIGGMGFAVMILSFLSFTDSGEPFTRSESGDLPDGYKIVSPHLPEEIDFCGEDVPLGNFEVKERLDREFIVNTYWHSSTILFIKRANRWFPIIEEILDENDIPEDFKYLSLIESNFTNVVSPAGATGFWQFMKEPAEKYGLEVNNEVDERYHIEKATKAACNYLKDSYEQFGNWTLAAASYNMGTNGIEDQIERQKTNNYYNMVLSEETSRYIFRILAVKEILNDPEKYGFYIDDDVLYPELITYEEKIDSSIADLAQFAINHGYNYKILKMYNPWLRDNMLQNKMKKVYTIKFPYEDSIEIIPENY